MAINYSYKKSTHTVAINVCKGEFLMKSTSVTSAPHINNNLTVSTHGNLKLK